MTEKISISEWVLEWAFEALDQKDVDLIMMRARKFDDVTFDRLAPIVHRVGKRMPKID